MQPGYPSLKDSIIRDAEHKLLGSHYGYPTPQPGYYSNTTGSFTQGMIDQVLPGRYPYEPVMNRIAGQVINPHQYQARPYPYQPQYQPQYQSQYQPQYQPQYRPPMGYPPMAYPSMPPQNYPPPYQQYNAPPYGYY